MNFLTQRIVFRISEAAQKWTIVKNRFLVPAKQKRNLSAFMLFSQQKRSGLIGPITQIAKQLGAQWKLLSQQQKKKYNQQAKIQSQKHRIQLDQYESKYVTPFKSVSSSGLAVKKLFQNQKQVMAFSDGGKKLKEYFSTQSEQEKKKFTQQATTIKNQRTELQKQFIIPEAQFKTFKSYLLHHNKGKSFVQASKEQQLKLKAKYQEYIAGHQKELKSFAQKHGLTSEDLHDIIKKNQRKLRKQQFSEEYVNQLGQPSESTRIARKRQTVTTIKHVTKAVAKKRVASKRVASKGVAKKVTKKVGKRVAKKA